MSTRSGEMCFNVSHFTCNLTASVVFKLSTGQLCSRLIVLLCPLSVPGHRSLWTGSRLLQRWRIHQVTILNSLCRTLFTPHLCLMIVQLTCGLTNCPSSCFQLSKQVPSESSNLRSSAGAVPESNRDLWTGVIKLTAALVSCHMLSVATKQTHHFVIFRLGPTRWTARSWNTAPRITSSRQRSVTSV